MKTCKYCGERFENQGKLLTHYKACPEKDKPSEDIIIHPAKVPETAFTLPDIETTPTCDVSGETFVLIKPDEYARLTTNDQLCVEQANIISDLQRQLAEAKQVTAEADGTIYWPVSRMPKEVSLLGEGQYLSLKVSGRIRGNRVEIEQAELAR